MRVETEIKEVPLTTTEIPKMRERLRWSDLRRLFYCICAALGIFGGLSALIIGCACTIIHSVVSGDHAFDRVGTVLLIIALPMLLIGSVFLDEININKS